MVTGIIVSLGVMLVVVAWASGLEGYICASCGCQDGREGPIKLQLVLDWELKAPPQFLILQSVGVREKAHQHTMVDYSMPWLNSKNWSTVVLKRVAEAILRV